MAKKSDRKLSTAAYVRGLLNVARFSFRSAPTAVAFKLGGVIVNALLPIAVTYFATQTINQLAAAYAGAPGAGHRALVYVIVTAVLGLLTTAWGSIDNYLQQVLRFKVESRVSDMMYEQFVSLDYWRYDDKDTADLYDKANKFSQFYAYIFDRLSTVVSNLTSLIFALAALMAFMPLLALAILIAVLPGVYLQFKLSRAQIAHWNENIEVRRARNLIEWNLGQPDNIAELRLNGLARYLMDLRQKLRDKDEGDRLQFQRSYIGRNLLADALQAVTEVGALVWVVLEIVNHRQPLGQFLYVQQLTQRAITSASNFTNQLSTIDEDLVYLFDYQEFMALPRYHESGHALIKAPESIEFSHVSFRYPTAKIDVLQDISFAVHAGQHVAIVGENGAGKTTLIKLLTGLYSPTKGQITLSGEPMTGINRSSWHKQLAVLDQNFQHYNFATVRDNVYFGNVDRVDDAALLGSSIDSAEARDFIEKLPQKLDTYPNQWMEDSEGNSGTQLSGGQWQRLALARSFYRDAPVIILDEPTSAIDALAEARIFDRLFNKKNRRTVITISHRLSTVEKADNIIVLEHGRIVEQGTHDELVARKGAYYKLFERQLSRSKTAA